MINEVDICIAFVSIVMSGCIGFYPLVRIF